MQVSPIAYLDSSPEPATSPTRQESSPESSDFDEMLETELSEGASSQPETKTDALEPSSMAEAPVPAQGASVSTQTAPSGSKTGSDQPSGSAHPSGSDQRSGEAPSQEAAPSSPPSGSPSGVTVDASETGGAFLDETTPAKPAGSPAGHPVAAGKSAVLLENAPERQGAAASVKRTASEEGEGKQALAHLSDEVEGARKELGGTNGKHVSHKSPIAADQIVSFSAAGTEEEGAGGFSSGEQAPDRDSSHKEGKEMPSPAPDAPSTGEPTPTSASSTSASDVSEDADPAVRLPGSPEVQTTDPEVPDPVLDAEPILGTTENAVREGGKSIQGTARHIPRGPVSAAWLRAALNHSGNALSFRAGWSVLKMKLDDGDGTVIIKAKREAERVAVSVGFSDPHLRAITAEHADRLQESLRQHYDAAVDLSLGDGSNASGGRERPHARRSTPVPHRTMGPEPGHAADPAPNRRYPDSNVWVG